MRRHVTLALAAAVALAAASQANAAVTLQVTTVPIAADLTTDGYTGYLLTIQASGNITVSGVSVPETVGAFDVANINTNLGMTTAGIIATSGGFNQGWFGASGGTQTPNNGGLVEDLTVSQRNDSTFLNTLSSDTGTSYWSGGTPTPFSENNTKAGSPIAGSGDTYSQNVGSPGNPDINTKSPVTWGLGTIMNGAGSAEVQNQTASVEFALIIAPTGTGNVTFYGQLLDQGGNAFVINQVINGVPTPEPASLGLLALGGLGLLAKRRKRA